MTLMSSAALGRHGRHGRPFSATIFRTTVDLPRPGGPVKINAAGLRYWYTPRSITSASFSCSKIGLVVISDLSSDNTGSFGFAFRANLTTLLTLSLIGRGSYPCRRKRQRQ